MSPARRWALWIVLLLGALGLVVFEQKERPSGAIVDAVPARASRQPTADSRPDASRESTAGPMILAIKTRAAPSAVDNAFPVRNWSPPPPPPPPTEAAPPPPPSAPPLPYTVFGKKLEDGRWQVFLRREDRVLVVQSLDTIDGAYRVDEIRPPVMALTYLPLQQKQTLPIGGAE